MNAHAQQRDARSPAPTAADARKLAESLMEVMSALLGVIEQETELVRAGKLREAMTLGPKKTELSTRYVGVVTLTVLATAHAVSESIVRGVNAEMQRRNIPNTYTAAGKRAAPGPRHITPLSVSRSL